MRLNILRLVVLAALAASCRAQATDAPWLHLGLDGDIHWIRDPEVFVDGARPKRSLTERVDRPALLEQALAQARKEHKPVLWYVYRIVENAKRGVQMYRAPVLDVYCQQVLFGDPDVAAIVDERFVPLRMVCDESMSARFGLRPLTFVEPALVFLDENGKVLHEIDRIRTFNASWLAEMLRQVLHEAGDGAPAEGTDVASLVRQGRWEQALAAVENDDSPAGRLTKATLLRRLRRPDAALAELDNIATDAPADVRGDALVERGLIATMAGDPAHANDLLDQAVKLAAGSRLAEAAYLRAWNTVQLGDDDAARQRFAAVAQHSATTTWGRRAKANVMLGEDERPVGAAFCGFEDLRLLPAAAYAELPNDTSWAGKPRTPAEIAKDGVAFLLRMQRDSGGFTDSRYAYWDSPKITPNAWVAITALAATALLAHRDVDPEHVDAALQRAESFMFDPKRMNLGQNEEIYADAYRLLYLARRCAGENDAGARKKLVQRMNTIIRQAHQRQQRSGFFAHEYPNAFCTAAMVEELVLARQAGAQVPDEMLDQAAAALNSARTENGAFVYGGAARGEGSRKDASGRMPVCEGALWALGQSDEQRVEAAFGAFWEFFDRLETVRRNDFHSDGELAGFFFFHDLFHASEVNERLPADQRDPNRKKLFAVLQRVAEMDGSFVDSHELGRSYGTAMALLTLANVARE